MIHAFYAERASINIGCGYADVLAKVATLRPYKSHGELPWESYVDQAYLITHVVFTLNNWGELALEPELLPHEHLFIRENLGVAVRGSVRDQQWLELLPRHRADAVSMAGHRADASRVVAVDGVGHPNSDRATPISVPVRERDAHLECLRAFGSDDSDPLIQLGMTFLLRAQDPNTHRWDVGGDAYTSYHATMVACQALLVHTHRGYGPGLPSCVAVLEKWHAAERPDDVRENPDMALRKRVDDKARKPPKKEASEEKPASPRPQKPAAEPKKGPPRPTKVRSPRHKRRRRRSPRSSARRILLPSRPRSRRRSQAKPGPSRRSF